MSFAVAQYRTARVETASPLHVVVQLYDGTLRFLRTAVEAGEARQLGERGVALRKAHAIVSELQATLDSSRAPELCQQLDALYDFVLHRIREASASQENTGLGEAMKVMLELRSAWAELLREERG